MMFQKKEKTYKLAHSRICNIFLIGAMIFYTIMIVLTVISALSYGLKAEGDIHVIDTGYSYRFDLLMGYANCDYENVPEGMRMLNEKTFCISFLLFTIISRDIPILIILNYFRKMLGIIKESHSPFVKEIVKCTKNIGMVLILMGLFGKLILQLGISMVAYHALNFVNPIEFSWIFAGIIVFLLSDVFSWGCELQQFSDETL